LKFLFDTCVISELVRKHPHQKIIDWVDSLEEESIFLSVLTIGEIEKGIAKLVESQKKKRLKAWVEKDLIERFGSRILPFDLETALFLGKRQGELESRGVNLPLMDSLIAATAMIHRMTVATRNIQDMRRLGVDIFDPWV
jgi:hypothetical protein